MNKEDPAGVIIGGLRSLFGSAPFAAGDVVVRHGHEARLHVVRSTTDGPLPEMFLDQDEWDALVTSGQATILPAAWPAKASMEFWVLRPAMSPLRGDLLAALVLRGALIVAWRECDVLAVVVDGDNTRNIRPDFAELATRLAIDDILSGKEPKGIGMAEAAFCLEPDLTVKRVAFLVGAYRRAGNFQRARDILAMVKLSRGKEFELAVRCEVGILGEM